MGMISLGILGSGTGSNMQAILDAISHGQLSARIAIVLSDNPDAFILKRAARNGIPVGVIDCSPYRSKFPESAQKHAARKMKDAGVDLICLAGFMRLVKEPLLDKFPSRIINIHPSLLPAFPGVAAWEQAVATKASETGVTVHVVDSGMDTGPVILQETIPVFPDETPEQLYARLQVVEHRIYPKAIARYASTFTL